MTTFDEREKEFEARFKHDQELQFKIKARRNRLLGLWAAEQMGLGGAEADAYAATVVAAQFGGGFRHVASDREYLIDRLHDQGVPIVVVSGYAVFPMAPEKVAAILQKPVAESQLLAALRPLLANKAAP